MIIDLMRHPRISILKILNLLLIQSTGIAEYFV